MNSKLKEILSYVLIIVVIIVIRLFIITPVRVDGTSMLPTFDNGNILLLNKMNHEFKRFDIVVFDYKGDELVKRVVGLPGDEVKYINNKLYINGKYIYENFKHEKTADFKLEEVVPKDKYFVLGDNRLNSLDSRYIGFIDAKYIKGSIAFSIIPIKKVK